MAEDNQASPSIVTGRIRQAAIVRCIYHAKQSRYQVAYYQDENILVMKCLECSPPQELARFQLAREDKPL